jgi:serine/threonine-protein kinase haspin
MRAEVYTGNPTVTEKTPDIDGIWGEYAPRTNLIWLLFLLKNLLKNRKAPSCQRKPLAACSSNQNVAKKRGRPKKGAEKGLVQQTNSNDAHSHVTQLKESLEKRLKTVLDLLDLDHGHEDMCCAADLVAYAIDSRWLDEEDFF